MALKPRIEALLERIKMILAEECNSSRSMNDFLDQASKRVLELIDDERKYGRH